jgi:hypothetical protein
VTITPTLTITPTITPTVTQTVTPSPDTSFIPVAKEFFPSTCDNRCYDTISNSYMDSSYTSFTHCIDFSNGYYVNSSNVEITYAAFDRPNRFNLYVNGGLVQTSGWVGYDDSYAGPWGDVGDLNTTGTTGSFSFTYLNTSTYEVMVEVGPANPSIPLGDSYNLTIYCPSPPPTPTPTITPTKQPAIYCTGPTSATGWKWYMYEVAYNNFNYPSGSYNPSTKTLSGLPSTFTPPTHGYNGYMRIVVQNCTSRDFYIIDQWTTINGGPIRHYPSNVLTALPSALNTYEGNKFTVAPYNT